MKKELAIKIMNEVFNAFDLNANKLSQALKMNRAQGIYDVINPKKLNVGISKELADKICIAFPTVNKAYLLTGIGTLLISEAIANEIVSMSGLPIIPFDAVAGWNGVDNPGVSLDNLDRYVVPEFASKGAEFIIRVSGSSMYPKYSNGDLLACRKVHEILFFQWGKIYVIDSSQGVMIKRIYEDVNTDMIICHSDNTEHYPRFSIPKTDIRSLSIVLGVIRME